MSDLQSAVPLLPTHQRNSQLLEQLFNQLFLETENTRLIGGAHEPLYLPADEHCDHHRLYYREDYFASAMHEIAHWCIAGTERRKLVDFGYWYNPDGRTTDQQTAFEQVEVKPQALEWIFTEAAGCRFVLSADNLEAGLGASSGFEKAVEQEYHRLLGVGLSGRSALWREGLRHFFSQDRLVS